MLKNVGPSIYIPTDKNIFDALQHKKVTQSELVTFLRKRGALVSKSIEKQKLVEKISALTLSYSDFQWLCRLLENPNRKDKTTHSTLRGNIGSQQIKAACETIKNNILAGDNESAIISKTNNTTAIKLTYVDQDFTKTELRQRTVKTCEIKLEESSDGIIMKHPSTKKAKEISQRLKTVLSSYAQQKGEELQELSISLETIASASLRSKFFDELIRNIEGLEFDTVTSVDVYHFESEKLSDFDDDDTSDSRLAAYINKAALAGAGVLESSEFNELHDRGFYIYKIVWTSIDPAADGPKVEFETQFGNPSSCTDFMYTVRGIYPFNERTSKYNVTRRAAIPAENDKYNSKLRGASEKALQEVSKEYGM